VNWLLSATSGPGFPDLAVYGVAAVPMSLLLAAIRWQNTQMRQKDASIEKLNGRIGELADRAVNQAERLIPVLSDASRILNAAVSELDNHDRKPPRRST